MAVTQQCIRAKKKKTAANLLDISCKLTVKNYHCHLLSSSTEITALDLCTQIYVSSCICLVHVLGNWSDVGQGSKIVGRQYQRESSLFWSWSLCLCVGLCVCACVHSSVTHVHVWVRQNSATLPSSSYCSRFVSPPTAGHKVTLCFYGRSPWCFT